MNDRDLLVALADAPFAACYAVAIAARVIGGTAPVQDVIDLTGHSRSSIMRARRWLNDHVPRWAEPEAKVSTDLVLHDPGPAAPSFDLPPEFAGAEVELIEQAATVPIWRMALKARLVEIEGARSWDLYRDVYAPAADECLEVGTPAELIGLVSDYYTTVTEEPLDKPTRNQLAKLVRTYGKAALYGVREALMRDVELGDDAAMLRYASQVCASVLNKARSNGEH